ncbi:hypothetical protein APK44_01 [Acinetobacter phage vB_AbaP_APK44]|nr:hypothetical protein APK44_01 [Acinetobacter phage vB_AbaP_APK44]
MDYIMELFDHYSNIPTYDYWTTQRSTIGIMDDYGNCVPMGTQAYDHYFRGYY